jgi:predicted amidohydrolase
MYPCMYPCNLNPHTHVSLLGVHTYTHRLSLVLRRDRARMLYSRLLVLPHVRARVDGDGVTDPFGVVLAQCPAEGDALAIAEVTADRVTEIRNKLPLTLWAQ